VVEGLTEDNGTAIYCSGYHRLSEKVQVVQCFPVTILEFNQ
jgi:hypothetical protein